MTGTVYDVAPRVFVNIKWKYTLLVNQDSAVRMATRHGLQGPGIKSQWGARFPTYVKTDPGAHPASCTMDTGSVSQR
jgi:hypothetical protein